MLEKYDKAVQKTYHDLKTKKASMPTKKIKKWLSIEEVFDAELKKIFDRED